MKHSAPQVVIHRLLKWKALISDDCVSLCSNKVNQLTLLKIYITCFRTHSKPLTSFMQNFDTQSSVQNSW